MTFLANGPAAEFSQSMAMNSGNGSLSVSATSHIRRKNRWTDADHQTTGGARCFSAAG
jgi:hypothetical protein